MTLPSADNATHTLQCRHCIGRACKDYRMKCHIVKTLPDGRIKVLVFGDRNWNHSKDKSRVRYVEAWRVAEI